MRSASGKGSTRLPHRNTADVTVRSNRVRDLASDFKFSGLDSLAGYPVHFSSGPVSDNPNYEN